MIGNANSSSHTLENQELVRFCCSKTAWCIHQRINAVLMHDSPADTFSCAAGEVNARDGLGNTALHVAARWGAPWQVLFRIMAMASPHLDAANHRGETFLHVLDPSSLVPRELAHIIRYLAGKGFGFAQLDETGQTFVSRLMASPAFTLESLEAVVSNLPEPDRLALVRPDPHHLMNCIRGRLLADPANTAESVAAYCACFTARYCTPTAPLDNVGPPGSKGVQNGLGFGEERCGRRRRRGIMDNDRWK
jgi:hypothetical protein